MNWLSPIVSARAQSESLDAWLLAATAQCEHRWRLNPTPVPMEFRRLDYISVCLNCGAQA